jgi:hypothetical protein
MVCWRGVLNADERLVARKQDTAALRRATWGGSVPTSKPSPEQYQGLATKKAVTERMF